MRCRTPTLGPQAQGAPIPQPARCGRLSLYVLVVIDRYHRRIRIHHLRIRSDHLIVLLHLVFYETGQRIFSLSTCTLFDYWYYI